LPLLAHACHHCTALLLLVGNTGTSSQFERALLLCCLPGLALCRLW
jgi:hypothetical protein